MRCHGNPNAKKLQNLCGDAMSDDLKNYIGPSGEMYPYKEIERQVLSSSRQGRSGKSLFSDKAGEWTLHQHFPRLINTIKCSALLTSDTSCKPLDPQTQKFKFSETTDPWATQKNLMKAYSLSRDGMPVNGISRNTRDTEESKCVIGGAPPRLCKYVKYRLKRNIEPKNCTIFCSNIFNHT